MSIYLYYHVHRIGDWKLPTFIVNWRSEMNQKQLQLIEKLKRKSMSLNKSTADLLSNTINTSIPSVMNCSSNNLSVQPLNQELNDFNRLDDASLATLAYRNAIDSNAKLFYGKTVLDIGGGSGMLYDSSV